ncbi:acetate--CoA ligase family protein [Desulfurivibrio alkaliphilus]|uniref:CoA-binding domain protein n=1 Tax=Desulfurivibrio alkaliphilus (strain DSM 19089 / UNIQEM U267 / AHT2) TaxID=589865 RepID=D6Z2N4_DESAT|nr:acetate--CoA ligase [Desulfurivibrio alkaliphilus]ADH85809.1 CoA-binding domain protein [Desulfurivibrio alkaliphilus AHT 2]
MAALESLLTPQSIAVIGASRTPGKVGHDILANLIAGGFAGRVLPVNPVADEILGLPCWPTLKGAGAQIDLGVIAVPRSLVEEAVEDCLAAGARAVAVITAGFKEMDATGAELEKKLAARCRQQQVRLLGPNCLGLINSHHRLNASFAGEMPACGNISVISQSGALATAILDLAAERHLGLAKLVSIGNKADLNEVDLLSALTDDEQTGVIVAYLEDISSGDDFVKAATEASNHKPVIILKSGTTEAGRQAATSHTGVLAGADIAYGAAFRRAGVIRADTFESLFDCATALAMQPLPRGPRVLIITNAGGPGTMAADAVEQAGLQVAMLDKNTAAALKEKLPRAASVGNPIDVLGDAEPERYAAAVTAAQDDPAVDAIVVILTPQAMTQPAATARAITSALKGDKPVLAAFMGGVEVMPGRTELVAAGLPDYPSPERAITALKAMHDYASWRRRPPRVVTRFRVNRRRAERIITRRRRSGHRQLGEVRAKSILGAYGFQIPEGYLATTADEAVEAAQRVGFPVAMKVVSPDIIHKSDLGGVKLNLIDAEAARDAFDLMTLRIGQRAPEARIEGIYVEKMLGKGLEVIIGMSRDAQFGPMLMFGLGGIFVEVMKDVTFHLAPISEAEAIQMLKSTRSYEILEGRRGQRGVDLAAIAQGLQRISQLTTDFPQIAELDINPFIVGEIGQQPMVADARITLEKA